MKVLVVVDMQNDFIDGALLGTDIVKSSMSMQNALAMTMWFVRDSLAIFLCAGKRALKVQQRAQRLSA